MGNQHVSSIKHNVTETVKGEKNTPPRAEVWRMFDRIAERYDLLNRLLSFGQDVVWRNEVAKHLTDRNDQYVLDVATGTGDLLISLILKSAKIARAVGVDMAGKMLGVGWSKMIKHTMNESVTLVRGDAVRLPCFCNTFDAVTIAFGIRNVTDVSKALSEMFRVLKSKGRVIVLEFSLPANPVFKTVYLFYFRYILPSVGALISGDRYAYRYLNRTVESFPYGRAFCALLEKSGFQNVYEQPLTCGIATIYRGDKP
jgi:demethylmenaquinone methyltransferase/2-methoxy-6-polyprenyl-1,4-benzoquinol methylase